MGRPKTTKKKDRIAISFTPFEEDIYDYLKGQRNSSALVKYLVNLYKEGKLSIKSNNSDDFEGQKAIIKGEIEREKVELSTPKVEQEPIIEENSIPEEELSSSSQEENSPPEEELSPTIEENNSSESEEEQKEGKNNLVMKESKLSKDKDIEERSKILKGLSL